MSLQQIKKNVKTFGDTDIADFIEEKYGERVFEVISIACNPNSNDEKLFVKFLNFDKKPRYVAIKISGNKIISADNGKVMSGDEALKMFNKQNKLNESSNKNDNNIVIIWGRF